MQTIHKNLTPDKIALIFGVSKDQAYRIRQKYSGTLSIAAMALENKCSPADIIYAYKVQNERAFISGTDIQGWYDVQQCQSSTRMKAIRRYFGKTARQRISIIEFLKYMNANTVINRSLLFSLCAASQPVKIIVNGHKNKLITEASIINHRLEKLIQGISQFEIFLFLLFCIQHLYNDYRNKN